MVYTKVIKKMSQDSVYKLLKKKREWMTTRELMLNLDIGYSSIWSALSKLKRHGEVRYKVGTLKNGRKFLWKAKK